MTSIIGSGKPARSIHQIAFAADLSHTGIRLIALGKRVRVHTENRDALAQAMGVTRAELDDAILESIRRQGRKSPPDA